MSGEELEPGDRVRLTRSFGMRVAGDTGVVIDLPKRTRNGYPLAVQMDSDGTQLCVERYEIEAVDCRAGRTEGAEQ